MMCIKYTQKGHIYLDKKRHYHFALTSLVRDISIMLSRGQKAEIYLIYGFRTK